MSEIEQNRNDKKKMRKSSITQLNVVARRIDLLRKLIGPALDSDPIIHEVAISHARMMTFNMRQCLADMVTHQNREKKVLIAELVRMSKRPISGQTSEQKDAG